MTSTIPNVLLRYLLRILLASRPNTEAHMTLMMRKLSLVLFAGILCAPRLAIAGEPATANSDDASHRLLTYKTTPEGELKLELFFPPDWKSADKRPAIVFFFGGGWTHGD